MKQVKDKKTKADFGVNLDKLIQVKQKAKEEAEQKHDEELSLAQNQKERRQVKKNILEERRASEVEWVTDFVKRAKQSPLE